MVPRTLSALSAVLLLSAAKTTQGFGSPLRQRRSTGSVHPWGQTTAKRPVSFLAEKTTGGDKPGTEETDALTKAAWYATEAFGKVFGDQSQQQASEASTSNYDLSQPPASVEETLARLQEDNAREYFLSGQVDKLIYDEDCEFADPFVSFQGRERFVENLANLGSFITAYQARPLDYRQVNATTVETKFMVKLELNLPWKPVLAWPWGVTCVINDQTHLIELHREAWDVSAWEGVKQVFRKPTTSVR